MLILIGTILVLFTWIGWLAVFVALGFPVAALFTRATVGWLAIRSALWWGLLIVAVVSYLLNLFVPLHSSAALAVLVALTVLAVITSVAIFRTRIRLRGLFFRGWNSWLPLLAVILAVVYMAMAALGPVTNFDSGLYHLGAISYAAEYRTIPGLANIYFPFGYSNAEFPLAALMGSGPWGDNGCRLLNGLSRFVLGTDFVIRLRAPKRSAGTYVMGFGILVAFVPMTALSDYWVTSPSQDSAVLFLTVAASGYLTDLVFRARDRVSNAATVFALAVTLVLFRPTMVVFGLFALFVVVVVLWRARIHFRHFRLGLGVAAALGLFAAVSAALRDYFLSGWLQFPLSILAFNVPWRATDPTWNREATLGYHRDPASMWNSIEGWEWVAPWFSRLPSQWESYLVIAGVLCLIVLVVITLWAGVIKGRSVMLIALAMLPSLAMVLFWWFATPPAFRFAWGPIFTTLTIPAGVLVWLLASRSRRASQSTGHPQVWRSLNAALVSIPVVLVVVFSFAFRLNIDSMSQEQNWSLGIRYSVTPIVSPESVQRTLESGLEIQVPVDSGLCWQTFPLCTGQIEETVRMRGSELQDGFLAK